MITGDEKWIVYNNVNRKRSKKVGEGGWTSPDNMKSWESPKKDVMLSVWWDYEGILHFELLYQEMKRLIQTSTFNSSPNWVMQLKKIGQNWQIRRGCCLPTWWYKAGHSSKIIGARLRCVVTSTIQSWQALSDNHLFRSMQNLNGKMILNVDDGVKSHLIQFFAGKNQNFYEHDILLTWNCDTNLQVKLLNFLSYIKFAYLVANPIYRITAHLTYIDYVHR